MMYEASRNGFKYYLTWDGNDIVERRVFRSALKAKEYFYRRKRSREKDGWGGRIVVL